MVLDATLLNTQHYKVRIKGKMEQSREWSNALSYTLVWSPSTKVANFIYFMFPNLDNSQKYGWKN